MIIIITIITIISIISIPPTAIASNYHANSILNHIPKSLRNAMAFHHMISKDSMVQCQNPISKSNPL